MFLKEKILLESIKQNNPGLAQIYICVPDYLEIKSVDLANYLLLVKFSNVSINR